MPELRVSISPRTQEMIEELQSLYGYDGHMKRGAFVDFAIACLYRDSQLDTSVIGNKKRAARILSSSGRWVHPILWRQVVKVVVGSPCLVYLQDIGEPYRISSEDWDKG